MQEQGIVRINSDNCQINDKGELVCETPENTLIEEQTDILVVNNERQSFKPRPRHRGEKPNTNLVV